MTNRHLNPKEWFIRSDGESDISANSSPLHDKIPEDLRESLLEDAIHDTTSDDDSVGISEDFSSTPIHFKKYHYSQGPAPSTPNGWIWDLVSSIQKLFRKIKHIVDEVIFVLGRIWG